MKTPWLLVFLGSFLVFHPIVAGESSSPPSSSATPTPAEPAKIEGAFGLKLGEVFDVKKAVGEVFEGGSSEVAGYMLEPPLPNPAFAHYSVKITPKTKKIYEIEGMGAIHRASDAVVGKARTEFGLYLINKYEGTAGGLPRGQEFLIKQGTREIRLPNSNVLTIKYVDKALEEEAIREHTSLRLPLETTGL